MNDYVCECCALMIANNDDSACRDYYGHTHPGPSGSWVLGDDEMMGWDAPDCAACETPQGGFATMFQATEWPVRGE